MVNGAHSEYKTIRRRKYKTKIFTMYFSTTYHAIVTNSKPI